MADDRLVMTRFRSPAPVVTLVVCSAVLLGGSLASAGAQERQDDRPPVSWVNPDLPVFRGLSHHVLASEALGHDVGYAVWLPPDYEASGDRRFPVVYFLHGMGGDESKDAGGFSSLVQRAIGEQWMPYTIVVFPNGGRSGYREGVEEMIVDELVPLVDAEYRTVAEPESRGLAGFSMGGAGSVWLSLRHPDLFGFAGSWGGGLWRVEDAALGLASANADELKSHGFAALFINGDQDRPDAFAALAERFSDLDIPHEVVTLPDTKHNLGQYYERAGETMAKFLGNQLGEDR